MANSAACDGQDAATLPTCGGPKRPIGRGMPIMPVRGPQGRPHATDGTSTRRLGPGGVPGRGRHRHGAKSVGPPRPPGHARAIGSTYRGHTARCQQGPGSDHGRSRDRVPGQAGAGVSFDRHVVTHSLVLALPRPASGPNSRCRLQALNPTPRRRVSSCRDSAGRHNEHLLGR